MVAKQTSLSSLDNENDERAKVITDRLYDERVINEQIENVLQNLKALTKEQADIEEIHM